MVFPKLQISETDFIEGNQSKMCILALKQGKRKLKKKADGVIEIFCDSV